MEENRRWEDGEDMGKLRAIGCFLLSLVLWPFVVVAVALGLVAFVVGWPVIGTKTMLEDL